MDAGSRFAVSRVGTLPAACVESGRETAKRTRRGHGGIGGSDVSCTAVRARPAAVPAPRVSYNADGDAGGMASRYYTWHHGQIHYQKRGMGDPLVLVHNIYPGASHEE